MATSNRAALDVHDDPVRAHSLRVAVVTETYPPEVNGVAATIAHVVHGLRSRGHALQLVRPRQGPADVAVQGGLHGESLMRSLPIPRYPQLRMGLPSRRALVAQWAAHRPDIVHLVTEGPLGWSALHAARQLQLPVVSDFRTNFHAYSRHYGVAWLHRPVMGYLRRFHNRTSCTMVPTAALASELGAAGFERISVVARGVDTRLFDPARRSDALRRQWGVDTRQRVLICVGRLAAEKNLDLLLDAYEAMRRIDPGLRLVLVGDGPARARLQQRCPQALFAGLRRGEDLAAHYASADLFVFPSLTETFGNVVPEAMASGLPVLAYDCAAASQLIRSGDNGWRVRPGDRAAFIAAAVRLAGAGDAVPAMGVQARRTASALDWGRIVAAVEAEYLAALAGAGAAPARAWQPAWPVP